ncbi:hypothetical protein AMS68_004317 [Peltaster fructicola]|uniref:Chromatin modification-related protein n=1 Tax=Peltaster fructicola TaxID=286661 RepID=A0A6H0XWI1_9PEZI|nr:hypothetical protein AMS68_004317 [Peltaster fructicola]
MPPYAGVRKASLISNTPSLANGSNEPRRTNSGRAVRASTTRPANYYARPFALHAPDENEELVAPIGFFPAVTFFTDAITALPREVVRQFTLMKEVQAKIHGPAEQLGAMCDELMKLPVPTRREGQLQSALIMSFTAPNSAAGSTNASLINGVAPNTRPGQESAAGSVTGEELGQETEESMLRRRKYAELRALAHSMLPNLDEKNVVLTEAIRVMNAQLSRIDGVMPHVDAEIPEEARLGSMTHWAYSDNRIKTKAAAQASRRDVVATHNLAAAAHVVHETEIAQTRRDAGKEARAEKNGKGRTREHVDSEFEEKPRKMAKTAKGRMSAVTGLGITTTEEPVKRRKVEKTAVPAMERQVSGMGRSAKVRETARSTPAEEKKTKPKSAPAPLKRRGLNSAQASPALASSPLQTQMPQSAMEPPGTRPQSARLRQNSTASNLRHERLADEGSRPSTATAKTDKNTRKRPREEVEESAHVETIEQSTEDVEPRSEEIIRPGPSRSDSNKTPSGGASKVGTPRSENFATEAMTRTRSTRSARGKDEPAVSEPPAQKGHKRNVGAIGSMSGLMKQIAPFNKSPDLDRHRSRGDSDDSDEEDDGRKHERRKSVQTSRPVSRRASSGERDSPAEAGPDEQLEDEQEEVEAQEAVVDQEMRDVSEPPALIPDAGDEDEPESPSPSLTPVRASYDEPVEEPADDVDEAVDEVDDVEEQEEGDEPDPDDPNEPKYCYCQRGSYGDMVGCDNDDCPREWFHLGCTGLKRMPTEEESWYCDYCKPILANRRRGGARGRGRA